MIMPKVAKLKLQARAPPVEPTLVDTHPNSLAHASPTPPYIHLPAPPYTSLHLPPPLNLAPLANFWSLVFWLLFPGP